MRPGLPGIEIDTTIFRPGELRRGGDRPPDVVAGARGPARRARARHLPARLAGRADQRRDDPAVARRHDLRAPRPRGDDQHDGAGRAGDRARRHRRRRHRRRGEHRAPAPAGARRRAAPSRRHRSSSSPRWRCGAPSSTRRSSKPLALLPIFFLAEPHRLVLQAARLHVRARGARLAGRGDDQHAGAEPDPLLPREAPAAASRRSRAGCSAATSACCARSSAGPLPAYVAVGAPRHRRHRRRAPARRVVVPRVQGTRLPDALAHQARDVAPGGATHRDPGQQGAAQRSTASATSARTSAKRSSARRSPASTSARTGSASIPRPTTTRRGPRSRRSSPATRGCSPTWRPTWRSGSAR